MINGNLGKDPVSKVLSSGKTIGEVSLAVSFQAYGDAQKARANEKGYVTEWTKLKAFGEGVDALMQYKKGQNVMLVNPSFSVNEYTNNAGENVREIVFSIFRASDIAPFDKDYKPDYAGSVTTQSPTKETAAAGKTGPWGKS
jgi:single-stranded DNA-binding protein